VFTICCPRLVRDVPVTDRDVEARTPTAHGTVVEFRCLCGGSGVHLGEPGAASGRLVHHQARAA
jgi:hypothetical protein